MAPIMTCFKTSALKHFLLLHEIFVDKHHDLLIVPTRKSQQSILWSAVPDFVIVCSPPSISSSNCIGLGYSVTQFMEAISPFLPSL